MAVSFFTDWWRVISWCNLKRARSSFQFLPHCRGKHSLIFENNFLVLQYEKRSKWCPAGGFHNLISILAHIKHDGDAEYISAILYSSGICCTTHIHLLMGQLIREKLYSSRRHFLPFLYLFQVSAYRDKFVSKQDSSFIQPLVDWEAGLLGRLTVALRQKIQGQGQKTKAANKSEKFRLSFEKFVLFVIHELETNIQSYGSLHWWPYSRLCGLCQIPYDFIGKLIKLSMTVTSGLLPMSMTLSVTPDFPCLQAKSRR